MRAYVEVRSQPSRGGRSGGYGGPDRYVAVQVVPDGVERLQVLNERAARKRGIRIIQCGEGYSRHTGPRSSFARAKAYAESLAQRYNTEPEPTG